MSLRLLAFDTSTEVLAVALVDGERWLGGTWPGGAAASATLLPRLEALLAEAGLGWRALDAIAFGRGPGAFTGLRTACAAAQGLAFGLDRPVLPVDSLAIVAEDASAQQPPARADTTAWVAMDARMDEVYAGAYRRTEDGWQVRAAPALYTLPALLAAWAPSPPALAAGSALAAFGARLPTGAAVRVEHEADRAGALARCARSAWRQGGAVDAAAALPLYLRDKVALTTAERLAQRRAA